jgi:hypothetical protein
MDKKAQHYAVTARDNWLAKRLLGQVPSVSTPASASKIPLGIAALESLGDEIR